jgi:hypothetical protein
MGRYLTTPLIVIACFVFFFLVEVGVSSDYKIDFIPSEVWNWLIVISIIVLALVGIGILPLSNKK